jgi:hypothetical protein
MALCGDLALAEAMGLSQDRVSDERILQSHCTLLGFVLNSLFADFPK